MPAAQFKGHSRQRFDMLAQIQQPLGGAGSWEVMPMTAKPVLEDVRARAASDGGDYRLEQQVGFLLRKAHQFASTVFQDEIGTFDVTPQQFSVLITLQDLGEIGQGRLGAATAMDAATLLGVAQRLAKRGLVAVREDPADRRRRLVQLTRSGDALAGELRQIGPRVSARILSEFDPDEQSALLELLERLGNRDRTAGNGS